MCRQYMKPIQFIALVLMSISGIAHSLAQELAEQASSETEEMDKRFSAMLKGATLKGTWAAVGPVGLGEDNQDSYQIVEAKKVKGDNWVMISRFEYRGQLHEACSRAILFYRGHSA